ncbi:MAG: RNA 2',3'-cyclic phosphodiesterase [Clostridiales bacterium]|nr:RNA 2',3'-cyclic phosphodiesterase [Clostridiales bacterium]
MRLFIAIPVPPDIRRAVRDTSVRLQKKGAEGRFVPERNYHVTMHFIGESSELSDIVDAMRDACCDARPFLLRLKDYGSFESKGGSTGFVRVEDESGELQNLYETLEQALWDRGFSKNHARLVPHITIGRSIKGDEGFTCPRNEAFTADSMILYETRNVRGSMEYTPVHKESFLT